MSLVRFDSIARRLTQDLNSVLEGGLLVTCHLSPTTTIT